MFTPKKSAIIFAALFFSSLEILVTQQPSQAVGDENQVKCTAPFINFGTYYQNCIEYTYSTNGGNGNGNNVNIGNSGKGILTRTGGGNGGRKLIRVRRFRRRV